MPNTITKAKKDCLYTVKQPNIILSKSKAILNKTVTKDGSKKLKTWISQPMNNKTDIDRRLDDIQSILNNKHDHMEISDCLRAIGGSISVMELKKSQTLQNWLTMIQVF